MDNFSLAKGMKGLALISGFLMEPEKNVMAIPFALSGDMDEDLKYGFHLMLYGGKVPYNAEDFVLQKSLDGLKSNLRFFVQRIFELAEHDEELQRQTELARVRQELKQSSRPHEMGTVAEIAAKFGISKSEVRRRKAEGTLSELFTKQST